jgi:hypothetical protein
MCPKGDSRVMCHLWLYAEDPVGTACVDSRDKPKNDRGVGVCPKNDSRVGVSPAHLFIRNPNSLGDNFIVGLRIL